MSSPNGNIGYKQKHIEHFKSLRTMQNERCKIYQKQDVENGRFDVTFEIDGKQLYAHKFTLTSVSEPLDSWLSDRWTTKDEVIKIDDYSYDEFYEFLTFLYSSECRLTEENIVKMTDMGEFYGVQCLKEFCDEFLTTKELAVENIEELFDFAQKYSLPKLKKSIKSFFWNHYDKLCKSDAFFAFKKPLVAFFLNVDISLYKKELLFEAIYKWAEHRVLKDQAVEGDLNLYKAVRAELSTFLPKFNFSQMDFDFLKDFVAEKGFLLSATKLSQLFLFHNGKGCFDLETAFKKTYELAEKQAMKKQEIFPEDNFILRDTVNAYLVDVMPHVKFSSMSLISLHFAVEKGYFLSPAEITEAYLSYKERRRNYSRESSFKETAELAEKLALKKQEMFPEENFNLDDSVKAYLVDILPNVEFSKMNFNFLMDFVAEKGFYLSPAELSQFFLSPTCNSFCGDLSFKNTYELAEKQALKKQEMFPDENFDLTTSINAYLIDVIPKVPLSIMSFDFLTNFVLEKGCLLSPADVSQYFLSKSKPKSYRKKDVLDFESSFKKTVELAEKVALKKQEMFPEDNFNIANSVKAYLVDVLPNIDFSKMDNSFLTDFIVSNGIISEEQANQLFETEVEIKNNGKSITGTFKDVHRIRLILEKKNKSDKYVTRQNTTKIRFLNLKIYIPSVPSTVEKMKGCDWYFCLEEDGILSFKHRTAIQQSDYLIAEMKSRKEFKLVPGETTFLTVRLKKV